jgi:hypothetical protein
MSQTYKVAKLRWDCGGREVVEEAEEAAVRV